MNQKKHTEEALQQFGMFDIKPMATPLVIIRSYKGRYQRMRERSSVN
jgi:hypothetical protein